jgi:hypothetical protein
MNCPQTEVEVVATQSGSRLAPIINTLGALVAAAAFFCALPYCETELPGSAYSLASIGMAAGLAYVSTRRPRRIAVYCAALVLVAFSVRLAWALTTSFPPLGDDYEYYRSVSLDLLRGQWSELFSTFWPWGYFLYLAALARLFGTSLAVPVTANAIVGAMTTLLVYLIARRLCEERGARVAAAIYALWPGVIYWSSVLCTEIPHLALFLAAMLCLLVGLETTVRKGAWLAAGGVLAALAEFVRALSPMLLLPFVCYLFARKIPAFGSGAPVRGRSRWAEASLVLGTYVVCLGALLTAESFVVGYPNLTTSHTMGMNLAFGLNWESGGTFNVEDALIIYAHDPREVNRRGMELAMKRLKSMRGSNWWRLPALASLKFQRNWSLETASYDAILSTLPADQRKSHWLATHESDLTILAQYFHAFILALAAVGFWRNRRSGGLALLGGILLAFVLLHTVMEVDSRYHFAAQSLLAVAGAGAFVVFCRPRPGEITDPRPNQGPKS